MFPYFFSQLAPCAPDAALYDADNLYLFFIKLNEIWLFNSSTSLSDDILNGKPQEKIGLRDWFLDTSGMSGVTAAYVQGQVKGVVTGNQHLPFVLPLAMLDSFKVRYIMHLDCKQSYRSWIPNKRESIVHISDRFYH